MSYNRFSRVLTLAAVTTAFALAAPANAAPWTPEEITTSLWLDAADSNTVTHSSNAISQWNDKSGNNRHATQTTGANQPTYVSSGQNSLNVIRLDGSTDYLNLGTGLDWMAGTSHVAFGVLKNGNSYTDVYGAANGSSGSGSLHVGFRDNSSYRINYWGNDYYPPITGNYDTGEFNFIRWAWDEGVGKAVFANGLEEGSNTSAGTISAMSGGGRISNVVGHGFLGADLAELVFLEGVPSQGDIDLIEGYLAWKWGLEGNLPSNHPYATAAPFIPEPSTFVLATLGLLGLGWFIRRKK